MSTTKNLESTRSQLIFEMWIDRNFMFVKDGIDFVTRNQD